MSNKHKRNNDVTETFSILAGKTIKRVVVLGVNTVVLECDNGKIYLIETVSVVLGISGMEVTELDSQEALASLGY